MAASFSVPATQPRDKLIVNQFLGADYTHDPGLVSFSQSPGCMNMVRDTPGKVRKAMGCEQIFVGMGSATIHSIHRLKAGVDKYREIMFAEESSGGYIYKKNEYGNWERAYLYPLFYPEKIKGINVVLNDVRDNGKTYDYMVFTGDNLFGFRIKDGEDNIKPLFIDIFRYSDNKEIKPYYYLFGNKEYYPSGSFSSIDPTAPRVSIGGTIEGAGYAFEPVNMLCFASCEAFHVDYVDRNKASSQEDLYPKLKLNNSKELLKHGDSLDLNYTEYKVPYSFFFDEYKTRHSYVNEIGGSDNVWIDYKKGVVTVDAFNFGTLYKGEDNIEVCYYVDRTEAFNKIAKCFVSTEYGVAGVRNRLFVTGNEDYPNYDWFSEFEDYSYFPDINYSVLGSRNSAIVGYATLGNQLVTFKDKNEENGNIILRNGTLNQDGNALFTISSTLSGESAVNGNVIQYFNNEPVFLTHKGIYAITQSDLTGNNVGQCRSIYLNGKLLQHDLSNAISIMYDRYYVLFVDGMIYLLDETQPMQANAEEPYSTRQYVGFAIDYMKNLGIAKSAYIDGDGYLYVGTTQGLFRFYKNPLSHESYNVTTHDYMEEITRIEPIHAIWETPDFEGNTFYKNKTFRYLAVRLKSALHSSVRISVMKRGLWSFLKEDSTSYAYLIFSKITFSRFSFSSDQTNKMGATKTRIKKLDKTRYRFENDKLNEPFGIIEYGIEYVQNGNYK